MIVEANSSGFKFEEFLKIQDLTKEILDSTANEVALGMNSSDIEEIVSKECHHRKISRSWHPTKVRIDQDTLLNFNEKSDPKKVIRENSIYFIDIGVVKDNYEGDIGRSFLFSPDSSDLSQEKRRLIETCERVFFDTVNFWRVNKVSGEELYKFASECAKFNGVELNLNMDGHRLGSFPHGIHYKGSLADINFTPSPNCWILEIQVKNSSIGLGAFYEDLIF